jgi:hypothetical protein
MRRTELIGSHFAKGSAITVTLAKIVRKGLGCTALLRMDPAKTEQQWTICRCHPVTLLVEFRKCSLGFILPISFRILRFNSGSDAGLDPTGDLITSPVTYDRYTCLEFAVQVSKD